MRLDINGRPIFPEPEPDYPTVVKTVDTLKNDPDPVVQDYADKVETATESIYEMEKIENDPTIPQIQPASPTYPDIPTIDPYDSSYKDLIKDTLSDILNYDDFSYDPNRDPSYQAYLQQMTTLGEEAFTNSLATMSSATGGMPNSWSQTVASQQQAKYMSEASANMAQFESLAYQKYLDKYNMSMDKLNTLLTMDDIEYSRYLNTVNQKYQQFEYEVGRYNAQLDEIQREIDRAWDRTNTLGYVTNEDSAILGLAPGTPSQELMLMKEEYDYYLKQLEAEMKIAEEQAQRDYQRELGLIQARADIEFDLQQRLSSLAPEASEEDYLTSEEMEYIRKTFGEDVSIIDAKEAGRRSAWDYYGETEKIEYIDGLVDRIYDEFYMSDKSIKSQFEMAFKLDMLERKPSYQRLYKPYIEEQERLNAIAMGNKAIRDLYGTDVGFKQLEYEMSKVYDE